MATDKYDLHTIDYSVQGWDAIMTTDMEKLDAVIHSRILITAGETIAQYGAVYLESDGKYDKAQADGTQQPALGLALESAVLNDEIRIQRLGPITNAGWAWATVGAKVYLDPSTPGDLTDTEPNFNAQMIGIVLSATSIFLWVDPSYVYDSELRFTSTTELTIAAGVVTKTQAWHTIDTQDDDPSDDLVTINGGTDGYILVIRAENAARTVVLKHGTGNLELGGSDITLADTDLMVPLIYDGTLSKWVLMGASAAGGISNVVEDLTPQLGGPLEMNEKTILVDAVLTDDHSWTGPTQLVTVGEIVAIFDPLYLKADGKYWKTDADAEATAKGKIVMATAAISADASGIVLLPSALSFIRDDSTAKWTVTAAGDEMYLSTAIGELTNDVSGYTTGDIVRITGYMETAVILNFDVDKTYVEIS